jgi:hypothetical protein
MKPVTIPSVLAALLLWASAAAPAQTLGDIARQEEARRKAVKSSGKVYTNDTLRREPAPAVPPAAPAAAPGTTPAQAAPAAAAPAAADDADRPAGPVRPEDNPRAEPYWRTRLTAARTALSRAETFAEALQSRINALTTDFVNRDDPAQQNVIGAERTKALAELDRVKQEIQQHQKAIATLQEDGRRAGVPAGWLR